MIKTKVRVRFAPSSTGFLHSGGVRTLLYNYLFAKKMGGEFYIRIEDTDTKRFHDKSVKYIQDCLEWMGIIPDDSPWNPNEKYGKYFQSKRDYSYYIDYLLQNDYAYKAYDTTEELDSKKIPYTRENRHLFKNTYSLSKDELLFNETNNIPYVVRLNVPCDKPLILSDLIRGEIHFNTNDIDDKVLVKSNGVPTYHLAHVVDDFLMGTTHVIRGDEWIPSTPIHLLLWEMFEITVPVYAHLSVILNPDGNGKLSKRNAFKKGFEIFPLECSDIDDKGDVISFNGFKNMGYEPISYINFVALLGFNFGKDVLTLNEMIDNFDLSKVNTSQAIFDLNKLNHINREHLLKIPNDKLWLRFNFDLDYDKNIYPDIDEEYSDINLDRIMELAKERSVLSNDLGYTIDIFYNHTKNKDVSEETVIILKELVNSLTIDNFEYDSYKNWIEKSKINKKELREVLCSGKSGPDLSTVMDILGYQNIINRINKYL